MRIAMELPINIIMDDAALERIAQAGIKDISVPVEFYDLDDSTIYHRAEALKERGITIDTCHLPHGRHPNAKHSTCSIDPEVFEEAAAMWKHYLARFAMTGMRATPLHMSGCMYPSIPQPYREKLGEFLEEIRPDAKRSGVIIALENTFYHKKPEFTYCKNGQEDPYERINDEVDMIVDFAKTLDTSVFGLCFDIGHANLYGHDALVDYRKMAPYVRLFHLHDNDGEADNHYLPGYGTINWGAFVAETAEYVDPMYAEILKDPDPMRKDWLFTVEGLIHSYRVMTAAMTA